MSRSREWATRIVHEMFYYSSNLFITLTYDDDHIPEFGSLVKKDLQKYFKRLRFSLDGKTIKYYACGEYGGETDRPHYHAILFGVEPGDLGLKKNIWKNKWSTKFWKFGYLHYGTVTYQSARYVANYFKKGLSYNPGIGREKPFAVMSKGIGERWLSENRSQVMNNLGITINGNNVGIPRYYKNKMKEEAKELLDFCEKYGVDELVGVIERLLLPGLNDAVREKDQELIDKFIEKGFKDNEEIWEQVILSRAQRKRNIEARIKRMEK